MGKLGIKSEKFEKTLASPCSSDSKDGQRYPTFSLQSEFLKVADLPKDLAVGDELTATIKLRVSDKYTSENEDRDSATGSIGFKILEMDVDDSTESTDEEDKEEKMLGYKREKKSDKVPTPRASDLE